LVLLHQTPTAIVIDLRTDIDVVRENDGLDILQLAVS